jgi:hypothetical protein
VALLGAEQELVVVREADQLEVDATLVKDEPGQGQRDRGISGKIDRKG